MLIKFELLNFQEILTITNDKNKVKNYIESIVKCIAVYFTKFSSVSFELNGYNCLTLYEMIYYFLKLKKYIYAEKEIFRPQNNENNKILFKRKFLSKFPHKLSLINHEDNNNEDTKGRERKDFAKRFLIKEKKKIKLPKNDLEAIDYDLAALEDENYEFLNFANLRKIFKKHTEGFLRFPEFKNLKDFLRNHMKSQKKNYKNIKNILNQFED